MKKFYIILFLFLSIPILSKAQSDLEDVVYLKNGGVTRGIILEMIPDSTIKIQTIDRNIFVYNFKEIIKISKESNKVIEEKPVDPYKSEIVYQEITPIETPTSPKPEYKQSGYHGILKFGPLGLSTYSLNVINGYQFSPYILLGLGVGFDSYKGIGNSILNEVDPFNRTDDSKIRNIFMPIYLDFRFHVSDSRATFFTYLNMGYSPIIDTDGFVNTYTVYTQDDDYYYSDQNVFSATKGGSFFCPGIGLKIFVSKNVGIVADFGIKFQTYEAREYTLESNYIYDPNDPFPSYDDTYSFKAGKLVNKLAVSPMINFGISF